jgi:hypothetical protein
MINEDILDILSSFYHPGDYHQTFVDEFIVLAKKLSFRNLQFWGRGVTSPHLGIYF